MTNQSFSACHFAPYPLVLQPHERVKRHRPLRGSWPLERLIMLLTLISR